MVGCGTIGSQLAKEIQIRFKGVARLIGLYDRNPNTASKLSRQLRPAVPIHPLGKLIRGCQLLIEAASIEAVGELLPRVIAQRKAFLVMSTGGLLAYPRLLKKAVASRIPLYIPSGALVGLDGVKAAALGKLRSVTLTTRKPPVAFAGAPDLVRRKMALNTIRSPRLLYQGPALKAISRFPQNINVAATLALAGIGPVRTQIRVVADPTIRCNLHEVEVVGSFGRFSTRTENRPHGENPRTSRLAVLSAVATLQQILTPLKVGT